MPPDVAADQDRVMLFGVAPEVVKLTGCPGATVVEAPALIEANIVVPAEYVMHRTVPDWHGDSPFDPFDVITLVENATIPALAFINSQEKPDPKPFVWAEIRIGALQTRIALLCTVPSSVVLAVSSITWRFQVGSFPETQGHNVAKV